MERLVAEGRVSHIGVSNVDVEHLRVLCDEANVRPSFVQNRCYASAGWDHEVRELCRANAIVYQGFSLLTANGNALAQPRFREIVRRAGRTPAQVVFRAATQLGMLPLTGTSDPAHMREDLGAEGFELSPEDLAAFERLALR
jgi:diketogulonate reductase-like aldo/keto reductase